MTWAGSDAEEMWETLHLAACHEGQRVLENRLVLVVKPRDELVVGVFEHPVPVDYDSAVVVGVEVGLE